MRLEVGDGGMGVTQPLIPNRYLSFFFRRHIARGIVIQDDLGNRVNEVANNRRSVSSNLISHVQ